MNSIRFRWFRSITPNVQQLGEGGGSLLFARANTVSNLHNVSASHTATFAKLLVICRLHSYQSISIF